MSSESSPRSASWPSKETNSVNGSTASFQEDDDRVVERVAEFASQYPDLADLPLSVTHGRKLRRIVTDPEFSEEWVEPEQPLEDAFSVRSLDRRTAATWTDAIHAFLRSHVDYEGLVARFADRESGDEFDVPLVDAWGEEYSRKQYARARALQRQMGGGERPTGGEAVPAWDDPATAMLTLTASSVPSGDRLSPVDHLDAIHDAFSYGGVRDALRNTMEYHLGLESDDWGYWLQGEPHGMGTAADDDKRSGLNACYTHLHVGVYFDAAATSLDLNSVGSEFERVIDKHVEECDPAGFAGHDYTEIDDYLREEDGCISLNADVGNLGSYMAAYMGGYTESLLDKPIEYIAWGALYWSTARQRTTRSQTVNQAIRADRCEQCAENEESGQVDPHGERVRWDDGRGADVVCSCCGSPWTVDQGQLDGPRETRRALDDDLRWAAGVATPPPEPDSGRSLSERWPSADRAWSYGESPRKSLIRNRVQDYFDVHGRGTSLPALLAHLNIDPSHKEFVGEILDGKTEPNSEAFDRRSTDPAFGYDLKAIVDADGNEHEPGGGGVDMVQLELPIQNLIENTRLGNDLAQGEIFRNKQTKIASHNAETIAASLLQMGVTSPEVADRLLTVEDYHISNPQMERDEPRPCMVHSNST
ncbi:hypothetical protein B9H04_06135 [Halorubrum ezzemoulense DSM 17463]|uniref:Uncharacterized protein n=1 Tax=Halorubrum ezzemoulense DSM 17463 TaxID=1121945 RepID=A0A1X4H966_HALEZ|nr:hypothetical protein [Halorubrum ezzemoulense]OSP08538.1 hypothetical protein B9H04_06135 [Halorubrum ezzemoulense DSM 17463]